MRTIAQMMQDADRAYKEGPPRYGCIIQGLLEEVHAAMDSRLNHIAAMCGHPDAAQGCRDVLDYIAAIRNGEEPLAI